MVKAEKKEKKRKNNLKKYVIQADSFILKIIKIGRTEKIK